MLSVRTCSLALLSRDLDMQGFLLAAEAPHRLAVAFAGLDTWRSLWRFHDVAAGRASEHTPLHIIAVLSAAAHSSSSVHRKMRQRILRYLGRGGFLPFSQLLIEAWSTLSFFASSAWVMPSLRRRSFNAIVVHHSFDSSHL